MKTPPDGRRFNVHGLGVHLQARCPDLQCQIDHIFAPFAGDDSAGQIVTAWGSVSAFDPAEVLRRVSSAARFVGRVDDLAELYRLGERYWLVDDRWGMCELDLLKHRWRSWVVPHRTLDAVRCVEAAVIWPMAQLLKMRGLELIPAVAVQREGWGALILGPYGLGRELACLIRSGFGVIGQRWTALVARGEGVQLLPVPGQSEMVRTWTSPEADVQPAWIDLAAAAPGADGAVCRAVFIVEPGRRAVTRGYTLTEADAVRGLRRAWPMIELPPGRRRPYDMAAALARQCRCLSIQLSGRAEDFVPWVESARRRSRDIQKIQVTMGATVRDHARKHLTSAPHVRTLCATHVTPCATRSSRP